MQTTRSSTLLALLLLSAPAVADWAPSLVTYDAEQMITMETLFDVTRIRSASTPPLLRVDVYGGPFEVDVAEAWLTAFHLDVAPGGAAHVKGSEIVSGGIDVCPDPPPGSVLQTEPIPEDPDRPDEYLLALRFSWIETCRPGPLGFEPVSADTVSFSLFDLMAGVEGEARAAPLGSFVIPRAREGGVSETELLWIHTSKQRIFGVASGEDGTTFRPGFNLAGGWKPDGVVSRVTPDELGIVSEEWPKFFGHLELDCTSCAVWSLQVFGGEAGILTESWAP